MSNPLIVFHIVSRETFFRICELENRKGGQEFPKTIRESPVFPASSVRYIDRIFHGPLAGWHRDSLSSHGARSRRGHRGGGSLKFATSRKFWIQRGYVDPVALPSIFARWTVWSRAIRILPLTLDPGPIPRPPSPSALPATLPPLQHNHLAWNSAGDPQTELTE